ncbi:MAG TPA: hypothetical protein VN371_02900 [Chlorobaculum sp.]|nr:hypothetical protein [Chlorobaculum sp.]
MKTISRPLSGMFVAVMLISVSACDNATENTKNLLLSAGSKVGKEAVQGSIAEFSKGIQHDPKSAKAYAGRGTVKIAMGDKTGAIADFTKAIELDPESSGLYTGRGTARFSSGDVPGAIGDFTSAAKVMVMAMISKPEEKTAP